MFIKQGIGELFRTGGVSKKKNDDKPYKKQHGQKNKQTEINLCIRKQLNYNY